MYLPLPLQSQLPWRQDSMGPLLWAQMKQPRSRWTSHRCCTFLLEGADESTAACDILLLNQGYECFLPQIGHGWRPLGFWQLQHAVGLHMHRLHHARL